MTANVVTQIREYNISVIWIQPEVRPFTPSLFCVKKKQTVPWDWILSDL